MLAIAAVLLAARLVGAATNRLSQPRVMGEVLAGILLGPTLLGAGLGLRPGHLFPGRHRPAVIGRGADRPGLLPFLVGMEIDPQVVRQRIGQAAFLSNTSVVSRLALGFLVALPVYRLLAPVVATRRSALFMGVAMSITPSRCWRGS
jgi:Kef-type K+ transport system membrane component KefB